MTDLDKLIQAVEAAEWTVTNWRDFLPIHTESDDTPGPILAHRAYHGSLDAAKALHDALLPGWEYTLDAGDGALVENRADFGVTYSVDASKGSIARCWLLAILRAYRSQVQK